MATVAEIKYMVESDDLSEPGKIDEICGLLQERESQVNNHLEEILSKQCQLEARLRSVGKALHGLSIAHGNTKKLNGMIYHTSELAENVSAKVRRLDEARSRVSECQQRVHDLIDLQLCSQGVLTAIKEEDFEKGAGHINRFLTMDESVLKKTADDVSESVSSVNTAVDTLHSATTKLRQLVSVKLDEAVKKDDLASVERFFKIYPQLGMHDEGIRMFSSYICGKLQSKAQKELRNSMDVAKAEKRTIVAFADTLTVLLENIARVFEVNQPIIENYYGFGYLLDMARILQVECDQEVRVCVLEFNKNRQIQRKITQINDYIKNGNSSSGARKTHYRNLSGSSIDKLNPKDIDALIGEICLIHSRADLYVKFIKRRVLNDIQQSKLDAEGKLEKEKQLQNLLQKSDLNRQMQEMLSIYLLFERYFMEESVVKAIAMDNFETGQLCSSMVDDVFFITRKCIRRSNTTQSLDGVCAVINNAASCFENDFIPALRTPLKAGYPSGYIDLAQAYSAIQNSIQQGKIQTSDTEQARQYFIVRLNNADLCTEYVETLFTMMSEEIQISFPNSSKREKDKVESCLGELKAVGDTLKTVVDFGMQQLRSSAIKPRLHGWVDDFLNFSHNLSEEDNYEAGETFMQKLIVEIDGLLNSFKSVLSARNYEIVVGMLATDVTQRLERVIRKTTFNRLGGLILDQEVRTLGSYLTSATSWSVRDKLSRLTQIATVLNLEKVSELQDFFNPSSGENIPTWRITPNEIKKLMALRTDFTLDEIKKLKI